MFWTVEMKSDRRHSIMIEQSVQKYLTKYSVYNIKVLQS